MWHQQRRGWIRPRLNESPSQKEGKSLTLMVMRFERVGLNESPSQKEGKSADAGCMGGWCLRASMKALPKRKGNGEDVLTLQAGRGASMKALPKRKGNR